MIILFQRKHEYRVNRPLSEVETRLKWIVTRRWDDYAMDIIGRLNSKGEFNITNKWPMTNSRLIENHPAYIKGNFESEDSSTKISINTKPNSAFIVIFYLLLAIAVVEILEMEKFIPYSKFIKFALPMAFCLVIGWLMIFYSRRLRKRFEELMQLSS